MNDKRNYASPPQVPERGVRKRGDQKSSFLQYLKVAVSGIGATVRGWIPTLTANHPKMMIGKLKEVRKN
jgi:hypothetical protein